MACRGYFDEHNRSTENVSEISGQETGMLEMAEKRMERGICYRGFARKARGTSAINSSG